MARSDHQRQEGIGVALTKIRKHRLELRGNLSAMLNKTKPAGEAGFEGQQSSLKLVAGA